MNKPKFETPNMTQKNIDKISQLFPNCITKMRYLVNTKFLQV